MAFIMDPIHTINIEADTTFVLMLEAQARGHEVWYLEPKDLFVQGGSAWGRVTSVEIRRARDFYKLYGSETVPLESFHVVWMRKDPPFDLEYLFSTYILSLINSQKTFVINDSKGLREANEKMYTLNFPDIIPETIITKDMNRLKSFLKDIGGEMVVKPIESRGGEGIFYVKEGDKNANVILESVTDFGRRFILAQKFIPEVSKGDKRIILLNGEPLGAVLRIARPGGEFRCNFHSGGSPARAELMEKDFEICKRIAPRLREDGLYFVGIDVVGEYLTEVNVTSPTGVQEINAFTGDKLEAYVLDFVEERVSN